GIFIGNARWASVDVTNNTLTATSAATSGAAHIYNIYVTGGTRLSRTDAVTNTINISNNSVQNCAVPTASAGRLWAIGITTPVSDSLSAHTINVNANSVTGNTNSSTSASDGFAMMGVVFQRAANQVNITNNIFTNNQLAGGSGAGNRMIVTGSPGNTPLWTCNWNISNNTLTNNGVSAVGGLMTGIAMENYAGNSMLSGGITISGNTITGVTQTTAAATGTFSGILCTANFNVPASAASIPATITNNTVSSIVRTASTTGAFTGISCTSVPTVLTMTGNQVINNSIGGTATGTTGAFTGITGPTVNGAFIPTVNISNNTVTGNTHNGTGTSTLINGGAGLAVTISNNTVGNHAKTTIATSTTNATITGITTAATQMTNYTISGNSIENMRILGIAANSTANTINGILANSAVLSETITNNTVRTLYTAGTASGYTSVIFGIRAPGSAAADRTIRGNVVGNLYNTGGNGIIRAVRSELGANVSISKNKVYDIYPGRPSAAASSTSVSVGISISSGSIHNVSNNIIGLDFALISVPTYTGNNAAMGIEVANSTTTHEVNLRFNTIRMSGNPGSGATFGSSGIAVTSATPPVVELSNNIVQNMLTGGGTSPGFAVAYRRANVLSAANYSDRSNNNLFFAGTPGAAQLIYFDGTNSDQTMAAYKTRAGALSPARDQASVTENVTFLNTTTGANANYLHINPAVATLVEGGGKPIASVLDDYDGDVRSTGGPDIGADEGNFLGIQPAFASVAASPATGQCTAVNHTVDVTTINGALPITGVLLNYSYNGVLAGSNPMTSTGANTWTGTIPAATPANATVTWNVIATDGVYSPTFFGVSYKDAYLTGVTVPVNATPAAYCAGGSSVLLAGTPGGNATVGTGTTANTASGYPTMFGNYWYQEWHQVVYSAAELAAAGLVQGNISAIRFNLNSPANPAGVADYTVRMGAAPSEFVTAFQTTGLTTVFGGVGTTYTTLAGVNTINLSTPYYWDGTSNLLVDVRVSGAYGSANAITVNTVKSTGQSVVFAYSTSSNPNFWTSNPAPTLSFSRPNITIVGNTSLPGFSVSWSDGSSTVGSGNPITVAPATTTTYTATLTDANGCTIVSTPGTVTVNPIPAAPTATPSAQCGTGIPRIKVSGGTAYNWYLAATGGTAIQSSNSDSLTSYQISTTTTFYVSNIDPLTSCESGRTAVVATVNQPDPIAASNNTGGTPICPGTSVILSVSQTGNTNTYSLSWSGVGASGLTGSSVTITAPDAGGTYTYTVNAVDGTCNATATTSITVIAPPVINNITANPSTPVCAGSSVTLTAVTGLVPSTSPTAYSFAQSAGTFTALAGGTNSTAAGDDGTELNVPIGFNFNYNGTARTTIGICTNGLLSFGTFPGSNWVNNLASNALILGPMWDDNHRSTGTISYLTTGTAPNRVFTVEWNQIAIGGGGNASNPKGTFQVKLFEGTDVIQYVYGPISAMTSVSASIGVSGSVGSYISVTPGAPATASTIAENTAINVATFLASGTTYTFTPPAQPGPGTFTWSWDNGAGTGNVVTVAPPSTTTYTVTATNPTTGCTSDTSITVVINQLPPAPVATNSTQCGAGVPTASVASASSDVAPVFKWYTSATGGTPVQSGTSTTLLSYLVTSSTSLFVSETSSTTGCEGPRSQVDITVIQPDSVATSVSAGPYCLGGSITLTATNTGSSNNYAYTWSSSAGSGISGSVSGATAVVTPTAAGTYVYTMSAVDGLCNYVATQTVTVSEVPSITSATASPAGPVCAGTAVTLTATTLTTGPQTAPTGYCASNATSQFDTKIDAVTLGTLSNSSNPTACETYSNFTATVPAPTLVAGQTYSASVTHGSCGGFYGGYSKMWIDFNRNGVFENPAELVLGGDHSSGLGSVVSGNVTIPSTATPGVTRMRVMLNESGSPTMLPCGTFTYGETEDYIVNVQAQGAGTYTWSWDNGAGTGNSVTVNPTVSTTYTVTATNAGGCTNTATVSVTALPLPASPTAVNGSRC
ncbi:MAG: GEVED domain-containing protein, partial [Bacteroidota bacterium]